ncbi:lipoma-preferred partner isoform X3 [Gadus morhua]|uniref:lipoma-preferred partner isoform X3 n=1 Tax=Gadus morhua TaxID=8049 RepID=UPI0011B53849|nr:lipoma-preferred partner homolog isoform X3 [Gadus morhua]
MWNQPSGDEPLGQVSARVETTPGNASISVSQQQAPKKFAPVVAPKPKFNPYKGDSDAADFLPPPPPPTRDGSTLPSLGFFPPPPPAAPYEPQMKGPEKTLEERRSSLDAEIDSLTSILADLESSSPYKPRPAQTSSTLPASPGAPVTGYKRMVIPTQPPLTATKKSTPKPPSSAASSPGPRPPQPAPPPQPVAASYATASTPSQPTFNVQVRSAQPGPQHQAPGGPQHYAPQPQPGRAGPAQVQYVPAQPKGPDFAYGPPQPGFSPVGPGGYQEPQYPGPGGYQDQQYPGPGGYQDQQYPGPGGYQEPQYPGPGGYQDQQYPGPGGYQDQQYPGPGGYQEPQYPGPGQQNAWRPEPAAPAQAYQPPAPRKTFINDPPASLAPMYGEQPMGPPKGVPAGGRPEDELERLTKKMLFDMENPPTEEYFGRCAMCEENVMGEGTGCTAMDQVFHVDCFVCRTCSSKLRGKPFYAVEKKAYCEHCYINTLESCTICSKPIMERILRATGKAYHPLCFTCVVCHRSLDGVPFTVDAANHIHCIEDFHKKFAPRCCVCSEAIMPAPGQEETVRIVALDRDFHVQCYRCEVGAPTLQVHPGTRRSGLYKAPRA